MASPEPTPPLQPCSGCNTLRMRLAVSQADYERMRKAHDDLQETIQEDHDMLKQRYDAELHQKDVRMNRILETQKHFSRSADQDIETYTKLKGETQRWKFRALQAEVKLARLKQPQNQAAENAPCSGLNQAAANAPQCSGLNQVADKAPQFSGLNQDVAKAPLPDLSFWANERYGVSASDYKPLEASFSSIPLEAVHKILNITRNYSAPVEWWHTLDWAIRSELENINYTRKLPPTAVTVIHSNQDGLFICNFSRWISDEIHADEDRYNGLHKAIYSTASGRESKHYEK